MEKIIECIDTFKPDVIYLGIGTSLKWHPIEIIDSNNNQQYPPFLNNYDRKLVILIDQHLEDPLYLESKIEINKITNETNKISNEIDNNSDNKMRVYDSKDNLFVFAINQNFEFENSDDNFFINYLRDYTLAFKKKFVIGDFSGRNIETYYINLLLRCNQEKQNDLLNNILYDVTQNDGGCQFDYEKYPIVYDKKNNFVQYKYKSLVEIKELSPYFYKINFLKRLGYLNYELTRMLRILSGEITEDPHAYFKISIQYTINYLSIIYNSVKSFDNSKENIHEAIFQILLDICHSLDIPMDMVLHLKENNYNQKMVWDAISPLRYLLE